MQGPAAATQALESLRRKFPSASDGEIIAALQQALERATGNEEIMAIAERILSQSYPSDPAAGSALAVQSNQRDISTVLVDAGVGFVKSNPIKMFLWLAGLLLLQFATGFAVPDETRLEYEKALDQIDDKALMKAQQETFNANANFRQSAMFGSCMGDSRCLSKYDDYLAKKRKLDLMEAENAKITSDAKAKLGVMSEYGVEETRHLFWRCFAGGKEFAKRSSWYDMMFMGITSMGRDESMVEFLVRWGIQVLMNFTMGLIGALVGFYWYVWGVISSYQPDFLTGVAMFFFAVISGTSLVATYLFALYGAAAGTVYVVGKAAHQQRLAGGQQRQQRFLRQQRDPRYQQQQQQQRAHYQ